MGDPIKHVLKEKNDSTIYFYEGFRVQYAAVSSKYCLTLQTLVLEPDGIKFSSQMREIS